MQTGLELEIVPPPFVMQSEAPFSGYASVLNDESRHSEARRPKSPRAERM